jgi:AsmA family protein
VFSSTSSQHVAQRLRDWRSGARGAIRDTFADQGRRRRLVLAAGVWTIFAVAVAVFFLLFSWDWFRGPLAGYLSARTQRQVSILGHLNVHPFSLKPWASVGGLQIANPKWMGGKGKTADMGRTIVQVELLPLLAGRVRLPLVDIAHPSFDLYADKSGRNNWTLGPKHVGGPAKLPPIHNFILRDGRIRVRDEQRRLDFDGVIATTEAAGAPNARAFRLEGTGTLNGAPFFAHITGGPLVHLQRNRPYPFNLDVRAGATHIAARGSVTRPFDFGRLQVAGDVTGPDLADLYLLTGVVLPNSPAYSLSGDMVRDGTTFRIPRFSGRVGGSDVHGSMSLRRVSGRKFLKADLASRTLDMTDIGAVFGGPQAGKAPAEEKAAAKAQAATGRVLPDAPLDTARVRSMDAEVNYRAQSVKASPHLPLRQVTAHATLDHGVLRVQPADFVMPAGTVRADVRIDARRETPVSSVDLAVSNVRVQDMLPKAQGVSPLEGTLEARASLAGAGDTVHRAAAAANGRVSVAMPRGLMRKTFAELLGVNVVPGLIGLLSKDPKQTDLRCMVADFDVRNGVMTARRLVLDTGVVLATGSGTIDLGAEALNLRIEGHTKKPRILRVIAPIDVRGSLVRPSFTVEKGKAIAQAGIAVGLGALLSPLAAVLPFLAAGGAHDANCAALLAEARSAGAPINTAQLATAAPTLR